MTDNNTSITLFDDGLGQATKAASGIISPWLSKRRNKRWYHLAKDGAEFFSKLVKDSQASYDVYQRSGTIITRNDPEKLTKLFELAKQKQKSTPAMGEVLLLDQKEVKQKMPILTNPPAGIWVSGGAKIDGSAFVNHLISQAEGLGVKIIPQKIKFADNHHLRFGNQTEYFDQIIVSAGAWIKQTVLPLGINLEVRPQKGQLIDLNFSKDHHFDSYPVLMPESSSDIIPFENGKLVIGATHEDDCGFDLQPTDEAKQLLLSNARHFISNLSETDISDVRVGTRAYTKDFAPFVGSLPKYNNIYVAGGLGSSGLTTGPLIGYLIAKRLSGNSEDSWSDYSKPISNYIG